MTCIREIVFENLDAAARDPEARVSVMSGDTWWLACAMVAHLDACIDIDPQDLVEHVRDWQDLERLRCAH